MSRTPGVALVTGGSAGIGRATADLLSSHGWTVVGASRRGTGGATWQSLVMDVDDDGSVADGVARILSEHGGIDAVVTAAGWGLAGPVETTVLADARAQLETNFWGSVRVVQEVLPSMRRRSGGRIVLVGSIGGLIGLPFQAYYSASKFALEGWAEALAYEVAPFGIDVTVIEPGNVRTGFTDARRFDAGSAGAYETATRRAIETMARDERTGIDPDLVAATILAQLTAGTPRRRVSVGRAGERVGLLAKRALPHRVFERAARSSLGVG